VSHNEKLMWIGLSAWGVLIVGALYAVLFEKPKATIVT
jgi:hypothetical protein